MPSSTPSSHRARSLRPRRALARLAPIVAVAALFSTLPALAQTDEIDRAKQEREATRAEAAALAADLDPLLARDAELEAAVESLELHVATQQAKLDAIQQSLAVSRAEADVAAERVVAMQLEIGRIRAALMARAVEAYVSPDSQRVDVILTSDDVTVAAHKRALLDTISTNEADLIDQLRAAEDQLADLAAEADATVARVREEEAGEADQLVALEQALADERRVRVALEARIATLEAEIDALEAEEEAITRLVTGLIADEEARVAAEAEARRRAEEQRRLAEQAERNRGGDDERNGGGDAEPEVPTPEPLPPPESSGGLTWPTSGVVTSGFGPRWGRMHNGIDIAAGAGTPIYAAQAGTVVQAAPYGGYGNMIVIDHGSGFTTVYAHLSEFHVSAGTSVGRGSQIGAMGCTGSCTGTHLHFETRVNGIPQDPMLYL